MAVTDALPAIRALNDAVWTWIVVLDDDPTGCQSVHDVSILVDPTAADLTREARNRRTTFVWTNSRSLDEASAATINRRIVEAALAAASTAGVRPSFVSRSDSTLRGHFAAELAAVTETCARAGKQVDGIVFVPAFLEAGRTTSDDTQWVTRPDGSAVPVTTTEFARDATFGYAEANLRDWVAARTGCPRESVTSIPVKDLRRSRTDKVDSMLASLHEGGVAIGNATHATDLETLALACRRTERAGRAFVYRTGPSFVRALMGQGSQPPLTTTGLLRDHLGGSGLVVVGSHTALTTRQLESARRRHRLTIVELDAAAATVEGSRQRAARRTADALARALRGGDAALVTSRSVRVADGRGASLAIARQVSAQVCEIVRALPPELPLRHIVAKGGITSHEVATAGLGMRRATVLGQFFPGSVSVLRLGPETTRPGIPFVVFPGNVGDDDALADVLTTLG